MHDKGIRWVARLKPIPSTSIEALLGMPLSLDVWERHDDALIVAASETQLHEIERRRLAHVERLSMVDDYLDEALKRADADQETRARRGRWN